MDPDNLKNQLIAALSHIAPETEDEVLDPKTNLQDQLDLDSVDIMNFIIKIQEDFNIEIPNTEYRRFLTIEGAMEFLQGIHS